LWLQKFELAQSEVVQRYLAAMNASEPAKEKDNDEDDAEDDFS
jgi:hypothetical protein